MSAYRVRESTMGELESEEPWVPDLKAAIIARACNDYLNALGCPNRKPGTEIGNQEELESFFLGPWFGKLCAYDGRQMILALRRHYKKGHKFIFYGPYADKQKEIC